MAATCVYSSQLSYPHDVLVYAILDASTSAGHPLGAAVDVFVRTVDAERFIEDVRRDDPELAARLRVEPVEFDAGNLN